ncbi:MAG: NUDIX domain-containing protein, partial [Deltaproteobacteria bacterium]
AQFLPSRGGRFPRTREEILEVPGIGPYTAGAILSIAFDLPEPLVDGNVQRVFARYYGVKKEIQNTQVQKLFWKKAHEEVIKAKSPRVHNQAIMELGSLICKKGEPLCERCPISNACVAFEKGIQKKLPVSRPRKSPEALHWISIIPKKTLAGKQELFLLKQNKNTPWWDGLWDFPWIEKPLNLDWEKAPLLVEKRLKRKARITPLNHTRHSVTHHRIEIAPFIVDIKGKSPSFCTKTGERAPELWLTLEQISQMPLSALAKKIFRQLPM